MSSYWIEYENHFNILLNVYRNMIETLFFYVAVTACSSLPEFELFGSLGIKIYYITLIKNMISVWI